MSLSSCNEEGKTETKRLRLVTTHRLELLEQMVNWKEWSRLEPLRCLQTTNMWEINWAHKENTPPASVPIPSHLSNLQNACKRTWLVSNLFPKCSSEHASIKEDAALQEAVIAMSWKGARRAIITTQSPGAYRPKPYRTYLRMSVPDESHNHIKKFPL
jgi:hypothetical protein